MSNDDPAYQQQRKSIPSVESQMRSSAEQFNERDQRRSFNMNYNPSVENDNSFSADNDDLQTFRVDPSRHHFDKDDVSTFGGDIKETSLDEMLLASRSTLNVNLE